MVPLSALQLSVEQLHVLDDSGEFPGGERRLGRYPLHVLLLDGAQRIAVRDRRLVRRSAIDVHDLIADDVRTGANLDLRIATDVESRLLEHVERDHEALVGTCRRGLKVDARHEPIRWPSSQTSLPRMTPRAASVAT